MSGRSLACICAVTMLASVAWIARGIPPGVGNADLRPLVAALHAHDYGAREAAYVRLLQLDGSNLPRIEQLLEKETDPEAAARLTEVALHLYLKARTSFEGHASLLGIKLSVEYVRVPGRGEDPVQSLTVAELEPGFPAMEVLQVGDRLIGMDGRSFDFPRDPEGTNAEIRAFRERLSQHPPGSVLRLTVLRDGKVMEVGVRVAGLEQSDDLYLMRAIEQRNDAAAEFLRGLKSGVAEGVLAVKEEALPEAGGAMQLEALPELRPLRLAPAMPEGPASGPGR